MGIWLIIGNINGRRHKLYGSDVSNWLTIFLMTSYQKVYRNFCEMGFQLKKKWQIDNIFKLVLTDKLTFHITFWWKYQQSKLFPFTSCSFHCIFRIHQLNGLLEDIGPCSSFEHGWASQNVSGGTLKKWKIPQYSQCWKTISRVFKDDQKMKIYETK